MNVVPHATYKAGAQCCRTTFQPISTCRSLCAAWWDWSVCIQPVTDQPVREAEEAREPVQAEKRKDPSRQEGFHLRAISDIDVLSFDAMQAVSPPFRGPVTALLGFVASAS